MSKLIVTKQTNTQKCTCGKCGKCKLDVTEQGKPFCEKPHKPYKPHKPSCDPCESSDSSETCNTTCNTNHNECESECKTPCCEKIGVILQDLGDGTISNTVTMLKKASLKWPVKAVEFRFLDAADGGDENSINNAVGLVESYVLELKLKGFKRFILPSQSTTLAPYLLGTAAGLGNVPFHIRHSDVIAAVYNPGTPVVDQIPNVWRFVDTYTDGDGALTLSCISSYFQGDGTMLILYEDNDVVSDFYRQLYEDVAAALSKTYQSIAIPFNGTNFDFTTPNVLTAINTLAAGSIIIHIPNGGHEAQWGTDGTVAGIFISSNGNGPLTHWGGNYAPATVSVPVDIVLGCVSSQTPGASCDAVELGFSSNWDDYLASKGLWLVGTGYFQAFAWLATCGKYCGDDNRLKFSRGGTLIGMFILDSLVKANTTVTTISQIRINPRWIDEDDDLSSF
ncbi:hypothetical protein QKU48_gp0605 [Fadolivirus algeromassiliense]|jgi:hypothetical protein|uniref:Uncharacterized protein n=1 Tax=Fadolivirus FV1/VV64 TaxID=3070911 RepID=A0A7D3QUE2_9VIRU|nr:hypothetical protein QKU48_gp0605 [Fadolivirus algeromassiliense]QKF94063.1 hypothetical protein Fadolivirus_1_605 [Fadolivirus FV1/VV64]